MQSDEENMVQCFSLTSGDLSGRVLRLGNMCTWTRSGSYFFVLHRAA